MASSAASAAIHIHTTIPRLRIVAFNDVYELTNLPRLQTFLSRVQPHAVVLSGDFLSPSPLSAVDGGKGMIATLRAVGVTHCCLGNHEADLKLTSLHKRLKELSKTVTIVNSNIARGSALRLQQTCKNLLLDDNTGNSNKTTTTSATALNPEYEWLRQPSDWMPEYAVVTTPCKQVKIALAGFLSDEPSMFRDGTFRGAPIADIMETYTDLHDRLVRTTKAVHWILPLTHQTIQRDQQLAQHMLDRSNNNGLILGGHEHVPYDVTVSNDANDRSTRILKSGCEARAVHLVDLTFDVNTDEVLVDLKADLVELSDFAPSFVVSAIVKERMAVLDSLELEDIVDADILLPPGVALSSQGTRYRQTTVGCIFCTAVKDELEVDVAVINGATIKGETTYPGSTMSYAALKQELPFPTKMVVVPMKRWELHDAIHFSRTSNPDVTPEEESNPAAKIERKGFLQVDTEFDRIGFHTGEQDDDLMVALPRNLLTGFCVIEPLMRVGDRLKAEGTFPAEDDYIRAIDLVVRHFCKERWFEMVSELHFADLDKDKKGFVTRADVKGILAQTLGHEPAPFLVNDMMAAIDADENGVIDAGEFSFMLAHMERVHGLIRFD